MKRVLGLSLILLTPTLALAAAPKTFAELANLIVSFLNSAAGLLIIAGVVIYFYGVSSNILKMSSEGGRAAREYLVWGIIVIFVMVSIWGILELLQNTLFGNSPNDPSTGASGTASFDAPAFPTE